jgi:hypothetical protein
MSLWHKAFTHAARATILQTIDLLNYISVPVVSPTSRSACTFYWLFGPVGSSGEKSSHFRLDTCIRSGILVPVRE